MTASKSQRCCSFHKRIAVCFCLILGVSGLIAHCYSGLEFEGQFISRLLLFYLPLLISGAAFLCGKKTCRVLSFFFLFLCILYPFTEPLALMAVNDPQASFGDFGLALPVLGMVMAIFLISVLLTLPIVGLSVFGALVTFVQYGGRATRLIPDPKLNKRKKASPANQGRSDGETSKSRLAPAPSTPQPIRFQRLANFIIDVLGIPVLITTWLDSWGINLAWWVWLLALPVYYFGMEAGLGVTFGKIATGTMVRDEAGARPGPGQIAKRTLLRLVPFEPLSGFLGTPPQPWHDKWSHTKVVLAASPAASPGRPSPLSQPA